MIGMFSLILLVSALAASHDYFCGDNLQPTRALFLEFHKRGIPHITSTPISINTHNVPSRLCLLLLAGDIALNPGPPQCTKLAFTNVRSIKNKSTSVDRFITGHNIDIFAITETWLRKDETSSLLSEITPAGYKLYHRPREDRRGGGVGFLVNCNISCKELPPVKEFKSFEFSLLHVALPDRSIHIACIYRPQGQIHLFCKSLVIFLVISVP